MRVVVIGGVAGGMSAATRLRRLLPEAEIVVVERDAHVSYANCGLPYHIGGVIVDRASLLLQTPESLRARFALDVRVRSEAVSIDREGQTVLIRSLDTGTEYRLGYDQLVLSPGAAPIVPPLPGIERGLPLRSVPDADRINALIADGQPRTAVVVGGGFIGVEAAENLRERGLAVTIVELLDQVLAPLDPEMVTPVHEELRAHGIDLVLGSGLAKVLPEAVEVSDGRIIPADLVILAIGVRPEVALARDTGLALGPRGGISVDESMRTSDPAIFAVGDAVEKPDQIGAAPGLIPLANTANRQGRLVADAIVGRTVRLGGRIGTAIVQVFGLTAAVVGWNEKRLRAAGRPYQAIHTHPGHHAGYYPGAKAMALKVLFDPETGAILGAQVVGREGIDKRIDVIATAMRGRLTVEDLADLELAYAPPYGSAKDPVNMIGYIAENLRTGTTRTVQWHELPALVAAGASILDVRTPEEFAEGSIPGAINIPVDELRQRLGEVPDGDIIINCQVGQRAHTATMLLTGMGRRVANLDGGYLTWLAGRGSQAAVPDPSGPAGRATTG